MLEEPSSERNVRRTGFVRETLEEPSLERNVRRTFVRKTLEEPSFETLDLSYEYFDRTRTLQYFRLVYDACNFCHKIKSATVILYGVWIDIVRSMDRYCTKYG